MFTYEIDKSAEATRVKVAGKLTEMAGTPLQNIVNELDGPLVIFNTRGVVEINSLGARLWILLMIELSKRPGLNIEFEECAEILMNYRALIPGMTGSAKIRSIMISYECDHCGNKTHKLLDESRFSVDQEIAPVECTSCGNSATTQLDPEELFSFMLE